MGKFLNKLISISGLPLSPSIPFWDAECFSFASSLAQDLLDLLKLKNGFYAFESALHVFPAHSAGKQIGVIEWNSPELWIRDYREMICDSLFFAEDIFGGQFCIKTDGIYSFEPETGSFEFLATDLEAWAHIILGDYETLTGYPLAHSWQQANEILSNGKRLIPKVPFVAGGEFQIENLFPMESVKAMKLRANLAVQIKNLPDGASITWNITD